MEIYLTTKELSKFIKESEGTIRNRVYKKEFIEGVHYIKPTPRKLLFIPNAIDVWLHRNSPKFTKKDSSTTDCRINV
jgi:hypothetical protein